MQKSILHSPEDMVRMCAFLFFLALAMLLGKELHETSVRYKNLEYELYNNQKSADDIIKDLRKKLSHVDFVRAETECLAKNIYFEANTESAEGKLAVATVTMNRVQSHVFPKTVCGVVLDQSSKGCQFSWVCDGKSDIIRDRSGYIESVKLAEDVLLSNRRSRIISPDVMYYHANYVEPKWAKTMKFMTTIGAHLFYRK
jgi:spore germination cell wall hydrolase CwlJ-like protein